jgi:hypothetical protein
MMSIYYTAKDIEELAAKGLTQLELIPGTMLTDFARETAEQLGIQIIKPDQALADPSYLPARSSSSIQIANKPNGCQHNKTSAPSSPANRHHQQPPPSGNSGAVNKLVDMMAEIMKRGD